MKVIVPTTRNELKKLCKKYKCQPNELKLRQYETFLHKR